MVKRYLLGSAQETDTKTLDDDINSLITEMNGKSIVKYNTKEAKHELHEIEQKGAIHYIIAQEGKAVWLKNDGTIFIASLTFAGFDECSNYFKTIQRRVEERLKEYIVKNED